MWRKYTKVFVCLVLATGMGMLITGCPDAGGSGGAYLVEYEVTGNATFASYRTPSGEQYQ